jgi:hypothetical protein
LFLIGYCLKKSPLKLLCNMDPNLAGSIYVRSSIKLLHLVPFDQQTWPPRLILFSDWLMLKKSSPLKPYGVKLDRKHLCKVQTWHRWSLVCPFQNCVRQPHPPFKMAAVTVKIAVKLVINIVSKFLHR